MLNLFPRMARVADLDLEYCWQKGALVPVHLSPAVLSLLVPSPSPFCFAPAAPFLVLVPVPGLFPVLKVQSYIQLV